MLIHQQLEVDNPILIYKLNKRLELSASLSNIFNQRTYNYTTYNQLSSFESQRWLRG